MKLILFDFDGVLVDTLGIAFSINLVADQDLSLEKYKAFFEANIYDSIKSGAKKHIPDFDEQYRAKTRDLTVPKILKKILQDLSLEYILLIVSSTPTSSINDILHREGALIYFKDIFGSDVHTSKVVKIKMLLEKYKVSPKEAVFITDTVGDILEARECGMEAIAVTWGFHDEKTLQKAKPAKIIRDPVDLIGAIKKQ